MKPRRILQWFWVRFLQITGALWWAKWRLRRRGAIVVLTCHRVLGEKQIQRTNSQRGMIVRECTFSKLVAHISRQCDAVDLRNAAPGRPTARLRVALTFDDGWRDNYLTAFPIARRYQIPLTIFICPGLVGSDSPFWPEQVVGLCRSRGIVAGTEIQKLIEAVKTRTPTEVESFISQLKQSQSDVGSGDLNVTSKTDVTMTWDEICEMHLAGVNFGCHTQTHQILTVLEAREVRAEVATARAEIESRLKAHCDIFAYPNGNWSPQSRTTLAESGFCLAFTTERGAWTDTCDLLAIPRSNLSEENVTGLNGRFSRAMFDYTTFWKNRSGARKPKRIARVVADQTPAYVTAQGGL